MKDLLKNNKQNIILIVVVLIVGSVMFYLALGFKEKTEGLKAEKNTLEGQTSAINNTSFLLDDSNLAMAEKNISHVQGGFNEHYKELAEKYNYSDESIIEMTVEDAQEKFDDTLSALNVQLVGAGVRVDPDYEYSFDGVSQKIFQMKMDEKEIIFEQLSAIKAIVAIVAASKVEALESIVRASGLQVVETPETFAKVYTFSLVVSASPKETQLLVNNISNHGGFYFRINNLNIDSPLQVDESLKSLIGPEKEVATEEESKDTLELDDLLNAAEETDEEIEVASVAEPVSYEKNFKAFVETVQTVKIDFDWVQFKETYLIKE